MLQREQPEERQLRDALSVRRRQTEDAALVAWLVADAHRRFRCLRTQEVSSATRAGYETDVWGVVLMQESPVR